MLNRYVFHNNDLINVEEEDITSYCSDTSLYYKINYVVVYKIGTNCRMLKFNVTTLQETPINIVLDINVSNNKLGTVPVIQSYLNYGWAELSRAFISMGSITNGIFNFSNMWLDAPTSTMKIPSDTSFTKYIRYFVAYDY